MLKMILSLSFIGNISLILEPISKFLYMNISIIFLIFISLTQSFIQQTLLLVNPASKPQKASLSSKTYYQKVVHNYDPQAKCLDGTPGLLYVHQGGDTSNFLIFFEGGGLCGEETLPKTLESCYQRSKTILGSSKPWPDILPADGFGYLSTDPALSRFAGWTKFIFGYCDGSLHQGFATDAVKYKDTQLYFRGAAITRSHFNWINVKYGLKNAQKVVLTGGSAGGIAVHLWNNYLRGYLKNPDAVYAIDDSGVFINAKTTLGNNKIQKMVTNTFKVANVQELTPITECNILHKGEEWRCLFMEYASVAIKGKFMVINSEYDSWAIPNILDIKCLKNASVGGQTLSSCSARQLTNIENYRSLYKDAMTKLLTVNSNASIWSIACSNHVYACLTFFYDNPIQKVPEIVGKTVRAAVQDFVFNRERVVSYDVDAWPANKACAK